MPTNLNMTHNILKTDKKDKKNTEKKKTKKNINLNLNKKQMWDLFDKNILNKSHLSEEESVECIYQSVPDRENCDLCGFSLQITEEGYFSCTNTKCGILYKDKLDDSAEWRYYGADDNHNGDPTRCGMPINPWLKESSYGCKLNCGARSSYEMMKIKRYTDWQSMPYEEKKTWENFQFISNMASNSGIPKIIVDQAIVYHKKISNAKTFRGLNRDGVLAASIYISCSINNTPRTAKEIAKIFHLDNASATKGCKNAVSIMNEIEHDLDGEDKTLLYKTTPSTFIDRYCTKLNINQELTQLCKFIACIVEQKKCIPENTPQSIATGIVYFVTQLCNLNVTKTDISLVSTVSEVTINKCYKKLEDLQDRFLPPKIKEKYQVL